MNVKSILSALLLGGLLLPSQAQSSAYVSSSVAIAGAGLAIYGLTLDKEDEKRKTFIISGVSVFAVSSTSSLLMTTLAGALAASGSSYAADQVRSLEQEISFGEGPTLDSIRYGYGLTTEEVDALLTESLEKSTALDNDQHYTEAGKHLVSSLLRNIEPSQDEAYQYLVALNTERSGTDDLSNIQDLSQFLGLEVTALDQTLDEFFAMYFHQQVVDSNKIVSQNHLLRAQPEETLQNMALFIAEQHSVEVDAQIEAISQLMLAASN